MSAFYDQASLVVVPSGYKSGKIYAQKPLTTDGQLTFTRASTATRVNASGLIEAVASGVPRLDYLGSTCPKLLLEPQRTNQALFSEQFNNAVWTLTRTSAFGSGSVANAVTSPDGYTNAEYIQQASGQTETGGCFQNISYTSGTTYTLSVFAKQGENRYLLIGFEIGTAGNSIICGFDLQEGIAGTPDSGISSVSIVDYGSGWYRCSVTATSQVTLSRRTFVYQSSNLNSTTTTPLQGIYLWGAQVEAGAYASSYIPTLSTSVTRVAEIASSASVPSLFGTTEGSFFIELTHDGTNTNGAMPLFLRSSVTGSFNQATYIQFGINSVTLSVYSATVLQASITASGYTNGQTLKIAFAYKANDFVLYVNGVQRGTDSSGAISNSLSFVDFGYTLNQSTFQYNGKISQALLFKTRLTNAQLAELSTL
jgi:hypothetical protein